MREISRSIVSMGPIDIDPVEEPHEDTIESIQEMKHIFRELLTNTGFSRMMEEVKLVGGVRKFEAVVQALEKEGLGLEHAEKYQGCGWAGPELHGHGSAGRCFQKGRDGSGTGFDI